ncbi:predicted protein [Chaetomium globosum CBS 148.51]|uniref:Uncharacterized protein n=1 Tax=Chaetomium globosum (strain ATCC 6205 / CBS 148.51 / DSM 1962 / NBRC 6347 / NRRL 1970) TaxID=306901 RepID=Q2GRL3_CHAGB|nr:uncharacterized protein CHGG_09391 [Chaetomium globosum CBS 148.51]EAQ85377.1 predicted protein [Chaetomium globosum CBS 148.51]
MSITWTPRRVYVDDSLTTRFTGSSDQLALNWQVLTLKSPFPPTHFENFWVWANVMSPCALSLTFEDLASSSRLALWPPPPAAGLHPTVRSGRRSRRRHPPSACGNPRGPYGDHGQLGSLPTSHKAL